MTWKLILVAKILLYTGPKLPAVCKHDSSMQKTALITGCCEKRRENVNCRVNLKVSSQESLSIGISGQCL